MVAASKFSDAVDDGCPYSRMLSRASGYSFRSCIGHRTLKYESLVNESIADPPFSLLAFNTSIRVRMAEQVLYRTRAGCCPRGRLYCACIPHPASLTARARVRELTYKYRDDSYRRETRLYRLGSRIMRINVVLEC